MITRTPLLPKSALDPLCLALLPLIGIVGFRLCLVVDHPLVPTASIGLLGLSFVWAGFRFALKFEPSHLSPLVLVLLGVSSGLAVAAAIAGFAGDMPASALLEVRFLLGLMGAQAFVTAGVFVELWRCEDWVPRATARRRATALVLLLAGGFILLSIAAVLTAR